MNNNKDTTRSVASSILADSIGTIEIPIPSTPEPEEISDEISTDSNEETVVDEVEESNAVTYFRKKFMLSQDPKYTTPRRSTVSIDLELMEKLKSVLFFIEPRCPLSTYLNNIIIDHVDTYREVINEEVSKTYKPTIL